MTDPAITLYRGAKDPIPAQSDVMPWDELVASVGDLATRITAADKTSLPAIAPHTLRVPYRAAEHVTEIGALVIDVDHCDLDALDARIRAAGIAALVYGSPSDDATLADRRVRVIAPVTRAIAPGDCAATRTAFAESLGLAPGCGVEGALDASRLFFVGRLEGTPARELREYQGDPVDVDALSPAVQAWGAPRMTAATAQTARTAPPDLGRTVGAVAVIAALGDWREYAGTKHRLVGAIGGVLRKSGWSRDDCASVVRAWLPAGEPGVDVEAGVRWACAAWSREPDEVSGRGALDAIVGAHRGEIVERAAVLGWQAQFNGARPAEPAPEAPPSSGLLRIVDRTRPPPELVYVVPGLDLAPGKVSVVQGFAYTAKTPFALQLAVCLAAGVPVLGCECAQRDTLYADFEGGVLTEEREARICAGLGLVRADVPLTMAHADPLSDELIAEIERECGARTIGAIVIDTYSSALPPEVTTFNDAGFRIWAGKLARLGERIGALVVCLVHENKGAGGTLRAISGSGTLAGAVQTAIALERPDEDDATLIRVSCSRAARNGFAAFDVRWQDVPSCPNAPGGVGLVAVRVGDAPRRSETPAHARQTGEREAREREAGARIMRYAPRGVCVAYAALARLTGQSAAVSSAVIARLVEAGLLAISASQYGVTEAGDAASELRVAEVSIGARTIPRERTDA